MGIFKRIEFWLFGLYALVGGGVVALIVFLAQSGGEVSEDEPGVPPVLVADGGEEPEPVLVKPAVPEEEEPFAIEGARWLQQESGHWLLELSVRFENESDADRELTAPFAQLEGNGGADVSEFFLALMPRPVVRAGQEEVVELRYWLSEEASDEAFELVVGADRVSVPAARGS